MLEEFKPEAALKLIEDEKPTIVAGVPAQLIAMVTHPDFDQYDVSSLRCFVWAGSPLPYDMALKAEERLNTKIVGCFGALDIGIFAMSDISDPPEVRHLTAGKLFPGMDFKLIDDKGKDVPRGEVGTFYCRGPSSFGCAWKDMEYTIEVWGSLSKDAWATTGDFGKIDGHGNLSIVGRKKDMILRGGMNIYPPEIENLLLTNPKVKSVAVVPMPDQVLGEKVCAYIIPMDGKVFVFDEMISFLKEKKIAPFKFPERLEVVKGFPMSGDGLKIRKEDLARDIADKLKREEEYPESGPKHIRPAFFFSP